MKTKTATATRHKARLQAKRPPHKKVLLHPLAVFLLLCAGVLLIGWTWRASADSFSVQGKVAAPPLADPAVITSPADGAHFKIRPITVSGTCPDDSYVSLSRNGLLAGTALCDDTTDTFSLTVDLVNGTNQLVAQDYNLTDDAGPAGTPITIYYDAPLPPSSPPTGSSGSSPHTPGGGSPQIAPLTVVTDFNYRGLKPGQTASWRVSVSGGVKPYALQVSWGDSEQSTYSSGDGQFEIGHVYKSAGLYIIKITAVDAAGSSTVLQIFSSVGSPAGNLPVAGSSSSLGRLASSSQSWLWLAWPAYLMLSLMVLSFWLGERTELASLRASTNRRRGRRRG